MKSIILGMISSNKENIPIGEFLGNRTGMIHIRQRCSGCDKHIVKIARSVEGVKRAVWNKNSNVLKVEFDSPKTSLSAIELAIAEAGHDTPNYRRNIKFYTQMSPCCQYREELNDKRF